MMYIYVYVHIYLFMQNLLEQISITVNESIHKERIENIDIIDMIRYLCASIRVCKFILQLFVFMLVHVAQVILVATIMINHVSIADKDV